jgi:hypothetical protein
MPIQQDTQLQATVGDLIFYQSRGKFLYRQKGNTGRQAAAARQQSALLGKASALSAAIRKAVKPILPETDSRKLMYRLNNALQQWLRQAGTGITMPAMDQLAPLLQFSWSAEAPFFIALPVQRAADNGLVLSLPAFESANPIHPLPFYGMIDLQIMTVRVPLDAPADVVTGLTSMPIPYDGTRIPPMSLRLPVTTAPGALTVVWLTVNGMSSGIVGSFYA